MQQKSFVIRNATEADVLPILKMHAQSWLDTYPNEEAGISRDWVKERVGRWDSDEKIQSRREQIKKSQISDDALYRVAENEAGDIIAIISPFRNKEVQRVGAIYVDKAYQGTGLAKELMDQIIAWADPNQPLELEVASYNERAKAFYRKYNFEELERSEHTVHEILPVVTMVRKGDNQ